METIQLENPEDLERLMQLRKNHAKEIVSKIAEEVVEREWDLLDLNLFISLCGKDKLNKATNEIQKLRKNVDKKEIDLIEYGELDKDF